MHLGDLREDAPPCGKPATWRFPAETGGHIYACDECIGEGRRYSERIKPAGDDARGAEP
jgi:hypothetical protein